MMRSLTLFIFGCAVIFTSCATLRSQPKTNDLDFVTIDSTGDRYTWKRTWNTYVADAIDRHGSILLQADSLPMEQIHSLCPEFKNLSRDEKKIFWVLVIASISKYESNFNPGMRYLEGPPLNVYSEGLLQLSYGDEKRYKNLPIDPRAKNILSPQVNLTSGVIILSHQIRKKKTLFTSKHFYWSVLTNKQTEIRRFIIDHLSKTTLCLKKP